MVPTPPLSRLKVAMSPRSEVNTRWSRRMSI